MIRYPELLSPRAVLRTLIVIASCLLLWACNAHRHPSATLNSVALRTVQIEQWQHVDDYVRLRYPRIVGDAAARLNPVIERWIGGHCPVIGPKPEKFDNIPACVVAFTAACVKQRAHTPAGQHFACSMDTTAAIRLDAAGLLGVVLKSYVYTGGAHGMTLIADLNLDLHSGRTLKLEDLLNVVDQTELSDKIERAMRRQRHIAADQSLKQAGFFKNTLPVPSTALFWCCRKDCCSPTNPTMSPLM